MAEIAKRAVDPFDVTVIARTIDEDTDHRIHRVKVPAFSRPSWLRAPSIAVTATQAARRGRFDLVHTHDTFSFGADLYTAHSSFRGYLEQRRRTEGRGFRAISRVYPPHVALLSLSRATLGAKHARVVTVSKSVRDELLRHYPLDPQRVSVVYNGVDLERFAASPGAQAREYVSKLVEADLADDVVLLFVGHEFGRKRLSTVIHALSAGAARSSAQLVVAGGDDADPYIRLAADLGVADRVHFIGSRTDIPAIMAGADAFVFPTGYEAASLAILEAAAAGLALITTDIAMAHEVLTDGHDALLLPNTSDPVHLARALDTIVEDRTLLARLRQNARATAEQFSWDRMWDGYSDIYRDILAEKSFRGE